MAHIEDILQGGYHLGDLRNKVLGRSDPGSLQIIRSGSGKRSATHLRVDCLAKGGQTMRVDTRHHARCRLPSCASHRSEARHRLFEHRFDLC